MTYAEYEAKINGIVADPGTLGAGAAELLAEIKKDTAELEGHRTRAETLQEDLNKANRLLFHRLTGTNLPAGAESQDPEEWENLKGIDAVNAYIKSHPKPEENK